MKPIIALTSQYSENNERMETKSRYFKAITLCGGIPIGLPQIKDVSIIAEKFDGFLFTGGDDVNPKLYGEEKLPECGFISDERDTFEIALLHEVMKLNKPILAICRGIQVVNVALGGTLYQHIEYHRNTRHDITIEKGNPLYDLYKTDKINVNSYHHQSVKGIAPSLKVTAYTDDGAIEALYLPDYKYFTALQWHPEILTEIDYDYSMELFHDFVKSC